MDIKLKNPVIKSSTRWEYKEYGVVYVDREENLATVHKYLTDQDEDWKTPGGLIKVAPESVDGDYELQKNCEYIGKRCINNVPKFIEDMEKSGIGVFVYWYSPER